MSSSGGVVVGGGRRRPNTNHNGQRRYGANLASSGGFQFDSGSKANWRVVNIDGNGVGDLDAEFDQKPNRQTKQEVSPEVVSCDEVRSS